MGLSKDLSLLSLLFILVDQEIQREGLGFVRGRRGTLLLRHNLGVSEGRVNNSINTNEKRFVSLNLVFSFTRDRSPRNYSRRRNEVSHTTDGRRVS